MQEPSNEENKNPSNKPEKNQLDNIDDAATSEKVDPQVSPAPEPIDPKKLAKQKEREDASKKSRRQNILLVTVAVIFYIVVAKPPFFEQFLDSGGGILETTVMRYSSENAAINYLDAMDALNFPLNRELMEKVEETITEGWMVNNPELETLLKQNQQTFQIMKTATEIDKCSFNFGRTMKVYLKYPLMLKMERMAYLLILNGHYYTYQKNYPMAVNYFGMALKLSSQLFQDNEATTKEIAIKIREKTVYPLISIVNKKQVTKPVLLQIQRVIVKRPRETFSAAEFVEGQKEKIVTNIKVVQREIRRTYPPEAQFEIRSFNMYLQGTVEDLQAIHFKSLDKYVESKDPSFLIQHYLSVARLKTEVALKNIIYTPKRIFKMFNNEIEPAVVNGAQDKYPDLSKKVGTYLFIASMDVDYSNFLNDYVRTKRALNSIQVIAGIKSKQMGRLAPPPKKPTQKKSSEKTVSQK